MASTLQHIMQPAQSFFAHNQPQPQNQYEKVYSYQPNPYSTQSSPYSTQSSPYSAQSSPYTPSYKPYSPTGYSPIFLSEKKRREPSRKLVQRYQKLEGTVSVIFGFADVCSCVLTLFLEAAMSYVLFKFSKTRAIPSPNRAGPWFRDTNLAPTITLTVASFLTFTIAVVGLYLNYQTKRKSVGKRLSLKVLRIGIQIACWIVIAILYKISKNGKDLWGWSCSEKAEDIQHYYNADLNFDRLCTVQTSSWIVCVIEVSLKILLAGVGFYFQFQMSHMKTDIVKESGEAAWSAFENLLT